MFFLRLFLFDFFLNLILNSGDRPAWPSARYDLAFLDQSIMHFPVVLVAPAQALDHLGIRYAPFQRYSGEQHLIISEGSPHAAAASATKGDLPFLKQLGADLEVRSLSPPKGFSESLVTPRRSFFIELRQEELLFIFKSYRHRSHLYGFTPLPCTEPSVSPSPPSRS